jgi:4-aminobutyrate aminotransferase
MPLGVASARADLMTWPPGAHASTFGGNPVSCAAALATLDLLEGGLIENAAREGEHLRRGLEQLQARHPTLVTDVRGKGLMSAFELISPKASNTVMQESFKRGMLVLPTGTHAIRLCPALTVSSDEVAVAIEILDAALAATPDS